jgi:hypothetical protein
LYYFEGHTLEEIAGRIGLAGAPGVFRRLAQARELIREALERSPLGDSL